MRSLRVGITGKIGSGKSALAESIRAKGIEVIDSDRLAKRLMNEDDRLRAAITDLLGTSAYGADGALDRHYVAGQIFTDIDKRSRLEAIVHPATLREIVAKFDATPSGPVCVESALIFQTDLWLQFDYIILVNVPDDVAIARLSASGRITEEDAARRLSEQGFNQAMLTEADMVIDNTGDLATLSARAELIVTLLRALALQNLPPEPLHTREIEEGEIN